MQNSHSGARACSSPFSTFRGRRVRRVPHAFTLACTRLVPPNGSGSTFDGGIFFPWRHARGQTARQPLRPTSTPDRRARGQLRGRRPAACGRQTLHRAEPGRRTVSVLQLLRRLTRSRARSDWYPLQGSLPSNVHTDLPATFPCHFNGGTTAHTNEHGTPCSCPSTLLRSLASRTGQTSSRSPHPPGLESCSPGSRACRSSRSATWVARIASRLHSTWGRGESSSGE